MTTNDQGQMLEGTDKDGSVPPMPDVKRLRSGFSADVNGEETPIYSEYVMKSDYDTLRSRLSEAVEKMNDWHKTADARSAEIVRLMQENERLSTNLALCRKHREEVMDAGDRETERADKAESENAKLSARVGELEKDAARLKDERLRARAAAHRAGFNGGDLADIIDELAGCRK